MPNINPTSLLSKIRPDYNINITINGIPDINESITNVNAFILYPDEIVVNNLNIISGIDYVNINGVLNDPFTDVFYYVDKGSSDKLMTPLTATGISELPINKDMFKVDQDQSEFKNIDINIEITYDILDSGTGEILTSGNIASFTITQIIKNEWDSIKDIISNYY